MKKLSIDFDLTQLQGASIINRDGRDFLVINLAKSRAKLITRKSGQRALFLKLDAVERKQADDNGNTHFIVEPTSKAEREQGLKLPIIGNAKEWGDGGEVKKRVQQQRQQPEDDGGDFGAMPETGDDDIPF